MNPTPEGLEARDQFVAEWNSIREHIPPEQLFTQANEYYDTACRMGAEGWDGTSQLEKDGRINQDLDT